MKKMSTAKYLTDITLNEMKLQLAELDHKIATTSLQKQSFLEGFKNELVIFLRENPEFMNINDSSIVYFMSDFKWYGNVDIINGVSIKTYKDLFWTTFNSLSRKWFYLANSNHTVEDMDDKKHILDTTLIDIASESLAVLKEEDYKSIKTMIHSKDNQDTDIAIQIMANCNYEKSKDIIALLFAFNHNELRYASNWQHVNVKAMRNALKKYDFYFRSGQAYAYHQLVKQLVNDNALTEFAVKVICEEMFHNVLRNNFENSQSVFDITIRDVKLKPEIIEKIKKEDAVLDDLPF